MTVRIRSHPPERRRRTVTLPAFGCCSCCCCCCLHTVGSLIAAARASSSLLKKAQPPGNALDERAWAAREQLRWPVLLTWKALALALLIQCMIIMLFRDSGVSPGESVVLFVVLTLIFLPCAQIVGGILASAWIALMSRHPDKIYCHGVVWKITGWAFLGAVLGILAMVPILSMCK